MNLKPSLAKTPAEVSRRVIVTLALGVQVAKKLPLAWVTGVVTRPRRIQANE
ncbi:MAG TPA: hypothetical protein VMW91_03155 [Desulfosporosinus sp.]|nr:hypothetical protein [Desulfosporosinus sp.]